MKLVDQTELMMNCLHGHKIPKSLEKLWDLWEYEQDFLVESCRITRLFTSLDLLMEDYGEQFMQESQDTACNIRAHHEIFKRLGFFALTDNQEYLAFDLHSGNSDNPPIVKLDSEGQYSWLGIDLEEAIYWLAEEYEQGETALEWLRDHRFKLEMIREFGASTQLLASLGKLHEQYYWEFKGEEHT